MCIEVCALLCFFQICTVCSFMHLFSCAHIHAHRERPMAGRTRPIAVRNELASSRLKAFFIRVPSSRHLRGKTANYEITGCTLLPKQHPPMKRPVCNPSVCLQVSLYKLVFHCRVLHAVETEQAKGLWLQFRFTVEAQKLETQ